MIEPQGWIKLHRKLLEHPLFSDPQAFMLWVQLLLRANHKEARVMIGNQFVEIKRGQLLTGRNKLSEHTGINRSKLERLLNLLEIEHQIEQQKTTKYRLISITNYDKYQGDEQQTSNKRATTEQQLSTNKNDNNNKNEKETIPYQLIADAYNQHFATPTGNSNVMSNKLSDKRKKAIKKYWNKNIESNSNTLDYWIAYFTYCATRPGMQENAPRSDKYATWRPSLDYLLTDDTMDKARENRL